VDLDALAVWVEGRYKLTPRITVGFRADRLGFSRIPAGPIRTTWESPMNRVEATVGYAIQRNVTARLGVQRNERDAGRVRSRTYISGQLAYWF
jgi:hypothetical protein